MDTYNETRIEGKRKFTLTSEGVSIVANIAMGPSYETHVNYDQLDPRITTIKEHHKLFWNAVLGIPFFAVGAFFIVEIMGSSLDNFLLLFVGGLSFMSLIVAIITRKRTEYARFSSSAGVPLLDIARSGPDSAEFDRFVGQIRERIIATQN